MKRIAQGIVAGLLAFSFVGCGQYSGQETGNPTGPVNFFEVNTPNGTYQCITWDSRRAGGLYCDPLDNIN